MIIKKQHIKKLWDDLESRGELIKSIGLGMFVNAIYGISDCSIEILL